MSAFWKSMMYAGLEKREFDELLGEARDENGHFVTIYASMTSLVFALCLLVSILAGGQLVINRPIYTAMIVISLFIYASARTVMKKRPALSTWLSILFIYAMYAYAFTVSLLHSDMQGVAAVAMLLVMPAVFYYPPVYMIASTLIAGTVYCLLSARMKMPSIAMLDLWNMLFFGIIAILLSVFQMRVKFRLLWQKRQNRLLSETDLLTGAKNRNCYENRRERYAEACTKSLTCVYVDANGLHEMNDTKGHAAGDRMLQAVADAIIEQFGVENTYRIGGDEFVALCADIEPEDARERIRGIIRKVGEAEYSVSVGAAAQNIHELDIQALIKEAEQYMYKEKRKYYEQSGHDRRRRIMGS